MGLVWPRSGLAVRHGIDTLAGVIDSDYRGELRVVLVNHGDEPFRIAPGDRIAQLLVQRVERARFLATGEVEETARGASGFGSTGQPLAAFRARFVVGGGAERRSLGNSVGSVPSVPGRLRFVSVPDCASARPMFRQASAST